MDLSLDLPHYSGEFFYWRLGFMFLVSSDPHSLFSAVHVILISKIAEIWIETTRVLFISVIN